ncbi:MAG: hypothetical protein RLN70_08420, partial [Rhodospirillaceae bacterium]
MAFAPLAQRDMAVFLDSALRSEQGRFSYIAADPFRVVRSTPCPWNVTVDGKPVKGDPFSVVAGELERFALKAPDDAPAPFIGGAIGFFGYELGGVLEHLPAPKPSQFPLDMAIGLYDVVVAFDSERRSAWVIASGFPETEPTRQRRRAETRTQEMVGALEGRRENAPKSLVGHWQHE